MRQAGQKTYLGKGSTRQKIATHAKNQPEKARLAVRVRGEETVVPGRKRTVGRGALQTRRCCLGSRAPEYGTRVGRWSLQAFGCAFDLGHQCIRNHLSDWPDCMGRKLGECHHISMSGNRKVSVGSERLE